MIALSTIMQRPKDTPPPAKAEPVIDDYHGHKITDPYRWLEDDESAETRQFVDQQNAVTRQVLDLLPGREKLRARIEQLLTIGRVASPRLAGSQYFYERRDGRQNQPVIYVRDVGNPLTTTHSENYSVETGPTQDSERALIDVNALAPDGTISLDWWFPSDDGKYVAYGTSANGSELSTLHVVETATGALLPEKIERTRAASVAWLPDNSGFYYTRYPRAGDVPPGQEMYNRRVFFHKIGFQKTNSADNNDGAQDSRIFPPDSSQGLALDPHPC